MEFVTFSKLAKAKELRQHFSKGRDGLEKVLAVGIIVENVGTSNDEVKEKFKSINRLIY